jgi:hypothetical protein
MVQLRTMVERMEVSAPIKLAHQALITRANTHHCKFVTVYNRNSTKDVWINKLTPGGFGVHLTKDS